MGCENGLEAFDGDNNASIDMVIFSRGRFRWTYVGLLGLFYRLRSVRSPSPRLQVGGF